MTSDIILTYFPNISNFQKDQFDQLAELYKHWNSQINVISRKDIDKLYLHHILHSLSIAKVISFLPGETVLDVGTGGGLPGIPLAILFPETTFHLVDSIGKKIKVVREINLSLNLKNTTATHDRADQIEGRFDFVVSRAVTKLKDFYPWVSGKFNRHSKNILKNGVLYLKGGDLTEEIAGSGLKNVHCFPVNDYFTEEFFNQKFILYFSAQ